MQEIGSGTAKLPWTPLLCLTTPWCFLQQHRPPNPQLQWTSGHLFMRFFTRKLRFYCRGHRTFSFVQRQSLEEIWPSEMLYAKNYAHWTKKPWFLSCREQYRTCNPLNFLRTLWQYPVATLFECRAQSNKSQCSRPHPAEHGAQTCSIQRTSDLSATVAVFLVVSLVFVGASPVRNGLLPNKLAEFCCTPLLQCAVMTGFICATFLFPTCRIIDTIVTTWSIMISFRFIGSRKDTSWVRRNSSFIPRHQLRFPSSSHYHTRRAESPYPSGASASEPPQENP